MLSLPIKYENNKFLISECVNLQIYQNSIHILRKCIGFIIHCKEIITKKNENNNVAQWKVV